MPAETILVPKDYTLEPVLAFAAAIHQTPPADEYIVDFQTPHYLTPFGMLYASYAIHAFMAAHPAAKFTPINYENYYAGHMGFFQACGFDVGKAPGEAAGSEQYLPITILPVAELQAEARSQMIEVGEVIEARSRELAKILTHQSTGALVDMLTYSLREMIRNVVEHSQSPFVAYCAQYQPHKKQAEIGILDVGVGIRTSLSKNPHLTLESDRDALNLALMPGISGKMFKGVVRNAYDPWQNSGYGLYAVSRLCGLGGKFLIGSGDAALSLKPEEKKYHPIQHQGVLLRLNLCSKDIKTLSTVLAQIMREGDARAKELTGLDHIEASTASRMLSSEFMRK